MGCTLLENAFDYIVQIVLTIISFVILIGNWWIEQPRRPWKIAALDGSKQGGGFFVAHVCNMALSIELHLPNGPDPCEWYWVNIMLDTTVRLLITFALFKSCERLIERMRWDALRSGKYGTPIQYTRWAKQLALWLSLVFVSKVLMGLITFLLRAQLGAVSVALLHPVAAYDSRLELTVVMVITPLVMNTFQLLVQDGFLKAFGTDGICNKMCCCLREHRVPSETYGVSADGLKPFLVDSGASRSTPTPPSSATPPPSQEGIQ